MAQSLYITEQGPAGAEGTGNHLGTYSTRLSDGSYVVSWAELTDDTGWWAPKVKVQLYSAQGQKIGEEIVVAQSNIFAAGGAVTSLTGGGFIITWREDGPPDYTANVFAQRFDNSGTAIGGRFMVNTSVSDNQVSPTITTLANGGILIAWVTDVTSQDLSPDTKGLYFQRFTAEGVKLGGEIQINTIGFDTDYPTTDFRLTALTNGGFVFSWSSSLVDGDGYGISTRIFDADGNALTAELQVNNTAARDQIFPSIAALADGGFVVAWDEADYMAENSSWSNNKSLHIQRFAANGNEVGDEIRIDAPAGQQFFGTVLLSLEDGGFLLGWHQASSDHSFILQRFDANGLRVGPELSLLVGSGAFGMAVTLLDDGGFALTWTEWDQVYHRAFTATGNDSQGRLIYGDVSNETITGSLNSDIVYGDAGNDRINGLAGDDQLDGGLGNDTLTGGLGNDTYIVNDAGDKVEEGADEGWDHVISYLTHTLTEHVEDLNLSGNQSISGYGNGRNNFIRGNDGNNILDGGAGDDMLIGGAGDDTYYIDSSGDRVGEGGAQGFDTVISSASVLMEASYVENIILTGSANINASGNYLANVLTGNDADNELVGRADNDTLTGGKGNDVLVGGFGSDTYVFALGDGQDEIYNDHAGDVLTATDRIVFDAAIRPADVTISNDAAGSLILTIGAGGGRITVKGFFNDQYSHIQQVVFADGTVWGLSQFSAATEGDDRIIRGQGNDIIHALGGNDIIYDNAGNDYLDGGIGADSMKGGDGNDTYIVDNSGDVASEESFSYNEAGGVDTVMASVTYQLTDGIENLVLTGTANINGTGSYFSNTLTGNGGNNVLDGKSGADTMQGGGGNDTYYVDDLDDRVIEASGQGTDSLFSSVSVSMATQFVENITLTGWVNINAIGNNLANVVTGNSGNNTLEGHGGNDILNGGLGYDTLIGGLGDDTYYIDSAGDRVTERDGEGTDAVVSSVTVSVAAWAVENVTLTGSDNIDITANGLDNILTGNSGNNSLNGRSGADRMIGGLGNDTYYVDNVLDRVTETDGQGMDTVFSTVSFSVAAQAVENVILTGSAGIEAIGNSLANVLTGNGGNNSLNGRVGADTLIGGGGHDTYYVDNIGDMVNELAGQGVDTIVTSLSYSLAGLFVEKLTLNGSAGNSATGNQFNNIITGNNGNNLIDGGAGADRMYGALGNDTFIIDDVNDKPTEKAGEGYDTLMTGITFSVAAQAIEAIILTGSGHIDMVANPLDNVITGNSGNNVINGRSGHDTIDGGAGNDTLIGSTGNDILTGGLGADIFLFSKKPGTDTITDFSKAQGDTINLNDITAGFNTASIVTQSGSDVIIDFGGGHILTIENAAQADVLTQIVW